MADDTLLSYAWYEARKSWADDLSAEYKRKYLGEWVNHDPFRMKQIPKESKDYMKPAEGKPVRVFALWKCFTYGCPDRQPQEHPTQPICYTCGKGMHQVKL